MEINACILFAIFKKTVIDRKIIYFKKYYRKIIITLAG